MASLWSRNSQEILLVSKKICLFGTTGDSCLLSDLLNTSLSFCMFWCSAVLPASEICLWPINVSIRNSFIIGVCGGVEKSVNVYLRPQGGAKWNLGHKEVPLRWWTEWQLRRWVWSSVSAKSSSGTSATVSTTWAWGRTQLHHIPLPSRQCQHPWSQM